MAFMLIKVNVPYPAEFLSTFSAQETDRQAKGAGAYRTACDDERSNEVHVMQEWYSVANAKDYVRSPEAKAHMASWHSVEPPEIRILRERPED